ncbi:Carboxyl-terminal-processing peptidase 3 [Arachis hypogaea]|nr:Carboxyl-terminal-processing peptidase 3 [Arachis hypogaea]
MFVAAGDSVVAARSTKDIWKTWFRLPILETHFNLLHRTFSSAASPAARAGIHQGDELVEINGERLDGLDSEAVAQRLRGNAGTTVIVKSTDQKALKKILIAAHDKSQKKVDKAIEDIQKDEGRDTK